MMTYYGKMSFIDTELLTISEILAVQKILSKILSKGTDIDDLM